MPEIIPNQTFKHGTETYEKGERYTVSEEDGVYFARAGWIGDPNRTIVKRGALPDGTEWMVMHDAVIKTPSDARPVNLDVHDSKIGLISEVK